MPDEDNELPSPTSQPTGTREILPSKSRIELAEEVEVAKLKAQREEIERRAKMNKFNDWIGFVTIKSVGISSLLAGLLELIVPALLPLSLTPTFTPFHLLGIGMAFLSGQK